MERNENIQLFEDSRIRTAWDETNEEWYFSIVDVVGVLTDSPDYNTGRKYWNKLKQRLKEEGSELVTNCHQLRMTAADGKKRLTDVADTEQLLRLIQSVPSPKAKMYIESCRPNRTHLFSIGNRRVFLLKSSEFSGQVDFDHIWQISSRIVCLLHVNDSTRS